MPQSAPPKAVNRRERNKQDKLRRIHQAARASFEEQGYDLTTIRGIAERADVGVGTVFLYARDKRDLLFLIFKDDLRDQFDNAMRQVKGNAPFVDQLLAYFTPILRFLRPNGALARILVREVFALSGEAARDMDALRRQFNLNLQQLIEAAQQRHEVRDDIPGEVLIDSIWANFRFYADDWLRDPDPVLRTGTKRLKTGLTLLVEGIGAG